MKKDSIVVVVPTYNEEGRIGSVVKSIPKTIKVKSRVFSTKVVVIEDGSRDGSAKEAKQAGAIVLKHVINCGAGAATRTGLKYAEIRFPDAEYVVSIDADGQHASEDIRRMVEVAEETKADMVVGNRLHSGNKKDMPLHRALGNWGLSMISRVLFGVRVADTQTGFRLFRQNVLPVVSDFTIDRYGFATEMLWLATRKKLRIEEVPITVRYSAETLQKGQNNWGVIDLVLSLLWIRISR